MASELRGVAELTRQLKELGRLEDGRAVRAAVAAGIKPALARARATAPMRSEPGLKKTYKGRLVAPGFLRRSVKTAVKLHRGKQRAIAMLGVRREAFYGLSFLELGTSRLSKRPWLVPAFETTQSEQLKALAASLRKTIDRIARKR